MELLIDVYMWLWVVWFLWIGFVVSCLVSRLGNIFAFM